MTYIIRRIGPTSWHRLKKCGRCRCGLGYVVGCFPSAVNRVILLGEP